MGGGQGARDPRLGWDVITMSCDWDIYCRTCGDNHGFNDANHRENLMWLLISHAKEIASLASLEADPSSACLEIKCLYGRVSPEWFKNHLGHDLVPRSEYGDFGTQEVKCPH
jgi:hypothetical protein